MSNPFQGIALFSESATTLDPGGNSEPRPSPFSDQARELAAALLEAAAELEGWADRGKTRHSPSPPDKSNNGGRQPCFFASSSGYSTGEQLRFRDDRGGNDQVNARDVAQAVELIRALCDQLRQMTAQLGWVESRDVTASNARACSMRLEAAALRRDIAEALAHIDRLQRRYLNGTERIQQGPTGGQPRAMVVPASQVTTKRARERRSPQGAGQHGRGVG
jgi:hypothetical protein